MKNKFILLFCIVLFSLTFVSSHPFSGSLTDGLTHYFSMDEAYPYINDSVGSDYGVSSSVNIEHEQTEAILGKSVYWNTYSTGPVISMSYYPQRIDETYSIWVKPDEVNVTQSWYQVYYIDGYRERLSTNASGTIIYDIYNNHYAIGNKTLNSGEWNNLVWMKGSSGMKIYLNGELIAYTDYTGYSQGEYDDPQTFHIGGTFQDFPSPKGYVDEYATWNRLLSPTEIQELYDFYTIVPEQSQLLGVLKFWEFDKLETPSITGDVVSEGKTTPSISLFFQDIINWFKRVFN